MPHSFLILNDHQLLLESFHGNLSFASFKALKEAEVVAKDYDPNYRHISDVRLAQFQFKGDEMDEVIEFLVDRNDILGRRDTAILATDPFHKVIANLLTRRLNDLGISAQVFPNVRQALDFLDLKLKASFIEGKINQLRQA